MKQFETKRSVPSLALRQSRMLLSCFVMIRNYVTSSSLYLEFLRDN